MKKATIQLLFILFFCNAYSQRDKLLLHVDNYDFLHPFILEELKSMINVNNDCSLFKEVKSLNVLLKNKQIDGSVSDVVSNLLIMDVVSGSDSIVDAKKHELFSILTKYDYLLLIKQNTLQELIEIQFQLFSTVKSQNNNAQSINLVNKLESSGNFFIDPRNSKYKLLVRNELKKLFPKSDNEPIPIVYLNDKKIKNNDVIYLPANSSFTLDASKSGDYEMEKIEYVWQQKKIKEQLYSELSKLDIKNNQSIQNLILKESSYKLQFYVYDGIQKSDTINFTLIGYSPLKIETSDPLLCTMIFDSAKSPKKRDPFIKKNITIRDTSKNDNHQKYLNYLSSGTNHRVKIESDSINFNVNFNNVPLDSLQVYITDEYGLKSNVINFKHRRIIRRGVYLNYKYNIEDSFGEDDFTFTRFYSTVTMGIFITKKISAFISAELNDNFFYNVKSENMNYTFFGSDIHGGINYSLYSGGDFNLSIYAIDTFGLELQEYFIYDENHQFYGGKKVSLNISRQGSIPINKSKRFRLLYGLGFNYGYYINGLFANKITPIVVSTSLGIDFL